MSKFNNTKNSYLVNEDQSFKKFSIAMNIISPVLCAYASARPIISQCCDSCNNEQHKFCKLVKYLKYKTESSTRNKIMANIFKKIIYSNSMAIFTGLCSIVSLLESWTGVTISLGPAAIMSLCILLIDCYYAVQYKYSTDQQLYNNVIEDIAYLHAQQSKYHRLRDLFFGISESDKKSERKRIFKSLINRGQIGRLLDEGFDFTQMLNAGVKPGFLYAIMPQLQPVQLNLLQAALQAAGLQLQVVHVNAIQLNAAPQPVQAPILQIAHFDGIQL